MLGKYELTIPNVAEGEPDLDLHIKVDTPADKYLLDYMRIKIVDREPTDSDVTES